MEILAAKILKYRSVKLRSVEGISEGPTIWQKIAEYQRLADNK